MGRYSTYNMNKSYTDYFKLLKNKTLKNKQKYSDEYINSVNLLFKSQHGAGSVFNDFTDPVRRGKIQIFNICKGNTNCILKKVNYKRFNQKKRKRTQNKSC